MTMLRQSQSQRQSQTSTIHGVDRTLRRRGAYAVVPTTVDALRTPDKTKKDYVSKEDRAIGELTPKIERIKLKGKSGDVDDSLATSTSLPGPESATNP